MMNETEQAIDYSYASIEQLEDSLSIEQRAKDRTWTAYREDRIGDEVYERRKTKQETKINELVKEITRRKNEAGSKLFPPASTGASSKNRHTKTSR